MSAPFYLVWCEDSKAVTKKHRYQHDALIEAQRLAKGNPGHNFYVVRATDRVRKVEVEHERIDDQEVPF